MSANRNVYIVGLTGGIASGKSEAARMLGDMGARCVDADAISRRLTSEPGETLDAIRAEFGDGVFDEDGALIRSKLADIVFGDPLKRKALDALTHPAIQKTMMDEVEQADKAGEKIVFLNVPLLFETGMDALCDETWLISCDEDMQLERLMERDSIDEAQAQARISSQMSLEEKTRRATVVIDNRGQLDRLYAQLSGLYQALVKKVNRLDREENE
ncbi:MAG: dephospho-CoA kinase [Clostridia bacterium]|nr:dephospho-CoA kinase [Clostridia bacterium]MBR5258237.1 dephospho-CoA kinase [Clostridia bacterium]MBR5985648.1 dephospho-CoA kinase [Clostridia bacterium]MBR6007769.1 dephospho-CoA kinase [Clostridia bacterium]